MSQRLMRIAVVELRAMPGSPRADPGQQRSSPADVLQSIGYCAVQDASELAECGFDAVILRNSGDSPHFQSTTPSVTIAGMAIIAAAVREAVQIHVGIELIEADPCAALGIAAVSGCEFVCVPLSAGPDLLAELARERVRLQAPVDFWICPGAQEFASPFSWSLWSEGVVISAAQLGAMDLKAVKTTSAPIYLKLDAELLFEDSRPDTTQLGGIILDPPFKKLKARGGQNPKQSGSGLDLKRLKELIRVLSRPKSQTQKKVKAKRKSNQKIEKNEKKK